MSKPVPYDDGERREELLALWHLERDQFREGYVEGSGRDSIKAGHNVCVQKLDFVHSPWGSEVPVLTGRGPFVADSMPDFPRPEFTAECWLRFPESDRVPSEKQIIMEYSSGDERVWSLFFDEDLNLCFMIREGEEHRVDCCSTAPLVDPIYSGRWYHVAAVFRNTCSAFRSEEEGRKHKMSKYSIAVLYCTPAGESFPRKVGELSGFRRPFFRATTGTMYIGGDADGNRCFQGAMAEVVVTEYAKRENQFATLGQKSPPDITISEDITCGSGRDAVLGPQGEIVMSGTRISQPPNAFCFYFRVDGQPGQKKFRLLSTRGNAGMASAAHISYDNERWERIHDVQFISDDGRSRSYGELHFEVNIRKTPAYISTSVPYLFRDVERLESEMEGWPHFQARDIGISGGGRPIRLWKITDSSVGDQNKKGILIQGGQHSPAEIQGSRVFNAMVKKMSQHKRVEELLKEVVFFIIPILNIDMAYEGGNTSLNRNGINLNRDWDTFSQEETSCVARYINNWVERGGRLLFALDFHAGGCNVNHVRGYDVKDLAALADELPERQEELIAILDHNMGFCTEDARHSPFSRDGLFRDYIVSDFHVPALTVELSCLSHRDPETRILRPMTIEMLNRLGKPLLDTCIEYCEYFST